MNPFKFFARKTDVEPDEEEFEAGSLFDEDDDEGYQESEALPAADEVPKASPNSDVQAQEPRPTVEAPQGAAEEPGAPAEDGKAKEGGSAEESKEEDPLLALFKEGAEENPLPNFIWEELQEVDTSQLLKECSRLRTRLSRRN